MLAVYPAKYKDRFGEETTVIQNDGKLLTMVVRGVEFQGTDWDSMEPKGHPESVGNGLILQRGSLCSCKIRVAMPVPVVVGDTTESGILEIELELGDPLPNGCLDRESLKLRLRVCNQVFLSLGRSGAGWFEEELLDLQRQLPGSAYIKACINCAYSDYSPYGHGNFGCLACFRDNREGYGKVASKRDLLNLWHTMTEYVQETFVCPEFARRLPGTGYRG
jgi:hypothetical protein